jgi:hypothetical protein
MPDQSQPFDAQKVRELAQAWATMSTTLSDNVSGMEGAVDGLAGSWTGDGHLEFAQGWAAVDGIVSQFSAIAQELADTLNQYAQAAEDYENKVQQAAEIEALVAVFGSFLGLVMIPAMELVGLGLTALAATFDVAEVIGDTALGFLLDFVALPTAMTALQLGIDLESNALADALTGAPFQIDWQSEGINLGVTFGFGLVGGLGPHLSPGGVTGEVTAAIGPETRDVPHVTPPPSTDLARVPEAGSEELAIPLPNGLDLQGGITLPGTRTTVGLSDVALPHPGDPVVLPVRTGASDTELPPTVGNAATVGQRPDAVAAVDPVVNPPSRSVGGDTVVPSQLRNEPSAGSTVPEPLPVQNHPTETAAGPGAVEPLPVRTGQSSATTQPAFARSDEPPAAGGGFDPRATEVPVAVVRQEFPTEAAAQRAGQPTSVDTSLRSTAPEHAVADPAQPAIRRDVDATPAQRQAEEAARESDPTVVGVRHRAELQAAADRDPEVMAARQRTDQASAEVEGAQARVAGAREARQDALGELRSAQRQEESAGAAVERAREEAAQRQRTAVSDREAEQAAMAHADKASSSDAFDDYAVARDKAAASAISKEASDADQARIDQTSRAQTQAQARTVEARQRADDTAAPVTEARLDLRAAERNLARETALHQDLRAAASTGRGGSDPAASGVRHGVDPQVERRAQQAARASAPTVVGARHRAELQAQQLAAADRDPAVQAARQRVDQASTELDRAQAQVADAERARQDALGELRWAQRQEQRADAAVEELTGDLAQRSRTAAVDREAEQTAMAHADKVGTETAFDEYNASRDKAAASAISQEAADADRARIDQATRDRTQARAGTAEARQRAAEAEEAVRAARSDLKAAERNLSRETALHQDLRTAARTDGGGARHTAEGGADAARAQRRAKLVQRAQRAEQGRAVERRTALQAARDKAPEVVAARQRMDQAAREVEQAPTRVNDALERRDRALSELRSAQQEQDHASTAEASQRADEAEEALGAARSHLRAATDNLARETAVYRELRAPRNVDFRTSADHGTPEEANGDRQARFSDDADRLQASAANLRRTHEAELANAPRQVQDAAARLRVSDEHVNAAEARLTEARRTERAAERRWRSAQREAQRASAATDGARDPELRVELAAKAKQSAAALRRAETNLRQASEQVWEAKRGLSTAESERGLAGQRLDGTVRAEAGDAPAETAPKPAVAARKPSRTMTLNDLKPSAAEHAGPAKPSDAHPDGGGASGPSTRSGDSSGSRTQVQQDHGDQESPAPARTSTPESFPGKGERSGGASQSTRPSNSRTRLESNHGDQKHPTSEAFPGKGERLGGSGARLTRGGNARTQPEPAPGEKPATPVTSEPFPGKGERLGGKGLTAQAKPAADRKAPGPATTEPFPGKGERLGGDGPTAQAKPAAAEKPSTSATRATTERFPGKGERLGGDGPTAQAKPAAAEKPSTSATPATPEPFPGKGERSGGGEDSAAPNRGLSEERLPGGSRKAGTVPDPLPRKPQQPEQSSPSGVPHAVEAPSIPAADKGKWKAGGSPAGADAISTTAEVRPAPWADLQSWRSVGEVPEHGVRTGEVFFGPEPAAPDHVLPEYAGMALVTRRQVLDLVQVWDHYAPNLDIGSPLHEQLRADITAVATALAEGGPAHARSVAQELGRQRGVAPWAGGRLGGTMTATVTNTATPVAQPPAAEAYFGADPRPEAAIASTSQPAERPPHVAIEMERRRSAPEPNGSPFLVPEALGEMIVARSPVFSLADAESAASAVLGSTQLPGGIPDAAEAVIRADIHRVLVGLLAARTTEDMSWVQAKDVLANELRDWEEKLQLGHAFESQGRLVWLRPVLRGIRPVESQPAANASGEDAMDDDAQEYRVAFGSTTGEGVGSAERSWDGAAQLINVVTHQLAHMAASVIAAPLLSVTGARAGEDKWAKVNIAGSKPFVQSRTPRAADLAFRIFVDGVEADYAAPASVPSAEPQVALDHPVVVVQRGLVVEYAEKFVGEAAEQPLSEDDTRHRGRRADRESGDGQRTQTPPEGRSRIPVALNAIDITEAVAGLHRAFRVAGVDAHIVVEILKELKEQLTEQGMRNRSRLMLGGGDVSGPIVIRGRASRKLFDGHLRFQLTPVLKTVKALKVASGIQIRDDLGTGLSLSRDDKFQSAAAVSASYNASGVSLDPAVQEQWVAVTGSLPMLTGAGEAKRGGATGLGAQTMNHTVLNATDDQIRATAQLTLDIEVVSNGQTRVAPVQSVVRAEVGAPRRSGRGARFLEEEWAANPSASGSGDMPSWVRRQLDEQGAEDDTVPLDHHPEYVLHRSGFAGRDMAFAVATMMPGAGQVEKKFRAVLLDRVPTLTFRQLFGTPLNRTALDDELSSFFGQHALEADVSEAMHGIVHTVRLADRLFRLKAVLYLEEQPFDTVPFRSTVNQRQMTTTQSASAVERFDGFGTGVGGGVRVDLGANGGSAEGNKNSGRFQLAVAPEYGRGWASSDAFQTAGSSYRRTEATATVNEEAYNAAWSLTVQEVAPENPADAGAEEFWISGPGVVTAQIIPGPDTRAPIAESLLVTAAREFRLLRRLALRSGRSSGLYAQFALMPELVASVEDLYRRLHRLGPDDRMNATEYPEAFIRELSPKALSTHFQEASSGHGRYVGLPRRGEWNQAMRIHIQVWERLEDRAVTAEPRELEQYQAGRSTYESSKTVSDSFSAVGSFAGQYRRVFPGNGEGNASAPAQTSAAVSAGPLETIEEDPSEDGFTMPGAFPTARGDAAPAALQRRAPSIVNPSGQEENASLRDNEVFRAGASLGGGAAVGRGSKRVEGFGDIHVTRVTYTDSVKHPDGKSTPVHPTVMRGDVDVWVSVLRWQDSSIRVQDLWQEATREDNRIEEQTLLHTYVQAGTLLVPDRVLERQDDRLGGQLAQEAATRNGLADRAEALPTEVDRLAGDLARAQAAALDELAGLVGDLEASADSLMEAVQHPVELPAAFTALRNSARTLGDPVQRVAELILAAAEEFTQVLAVADALAVHSEVGARAVSVLPGIPAWNAVDPEREIIGTAKALADGMAGLAARARSFADLLRVLSQREGEFVQGMSDFAGRVGALLGHLARSAELVDPDESIEAADTAQRGIEELVDSVAVLRQQAHDIGERVQGVVQAHGPDLPGDARTFTDLARRLEGPIRDTPPVTRGYRLIVPTTAMHAEYMDAREVFTRIVRILVASGLLRETPDGERVIADALYRSVRSNFSSEALRDQFHALLGSGVVGWYALPRVSGMGARFLRLRVRATKLSVPTAHRPRAETKMMLRSESVMQTENAKEKSARQFAFVGGKINGGSSSIHGGGGLDSAVDLQGATSSGELTKKVDIFRVDPREPLEEFDHRIDFIIEADVANTLPAFAQAPLDLLRGTWNGAVSLVPESVATGRAVAAAETVLKYIGTSAPVDVLRLTWTRLSPSVGAKGSQGPYTVLDGTVRVLVPSSFTAPLSDGPTVVQEWSRPEPEKFHHAWAPAFEVGTLGEAAEGAVKDMHPWGGPAFHAVQTWAALVAAGAVTPPLLDTEAEVSGALRATRLSPGSLEEARYEQAVSYNTLRPRLEVLLRGRYLVPVGGRMVRVRFRLTAAHGYLETGKPLKVRRYSPTTTAPKNENASSFAYGFGAGLDIVGVPRHSLHTIFNAPGKYEWKAESKNSHEVGNTVESNRVRDKVSYRTMLFDVAIDMQWADSPVRSLVVLVPNGLSASVPYRNEADLRSRLADLGAPLQTPPLPVVPPTAPARPASVASAGAPGEPDPTAAVNPAVQAAWELHLSGRTRSRAEAGTRGATTASAAAAWEQWLSVSRSQGAAGPARNVAAIGRAFNEMIAWGPMPSRVATWRRQFEQSWREQHAEAAPVPSAPLPPATVRSAPPVADEEPRIPGAFPATVPAHDALLPRGSRPDTPSPEEQQQAERDLDAAEQTLRALGLAPERLASSYADFVRDWAGQHNKPNGGGATAVRPDTYRAAAPAFGVDFAPGSTELDQAGRTALYRAARSLTYAVATWWAQGAEVLPTVEVVVTGAPRLAAERGRVVERYLRWAMANHRIRITAAPRMRVDFSVSTRPPGVFGGKRGHAEVRLNEEQAVQAALADPQGMEDTRITYPLRMPADAAGLRTELLRGDQPSRLLLLAELPAEHRRWLAADPATIDALAAALPPEDFAALAAKLMVDVPQGVEAPLAARYELEQIATRMLVNVEIATELLLRGTRLVVIPRDGDVRSLGHSPIRWMRATLPERDFTHPAHPPVAMLAEENLVGVRDKAGRVRYTNGDSSAIHEIAHLAHRMLAASRQKVITEVYNAVREADERQISTDGPGVVLASRWPNGPLYAVRDAQTQQVSGYNYASTNEDEFFATLVSTWMGTNLQPDVVTGLATNNGNGWITRSLQPLVDIDLQPLVDLLTDLFGPGHHGRHEFTANPVNSELQFEYLAEFEAQLAADAQEAWQVARAALESARSSLDAFGDEPLAWSVGDPPEAWTEAVDALGQAHDDLAAAESRLRALGNDPAFPAAEHEESPADPVADPAMRNAWRRVLEEQAARASGTEADGAELEQAWQQWRAARTALVPTRSALAGLAARGGGEVTGVSDNDATHHAPFARGGTRTQPEQGSAAPAAPLPGTYRSGTEPVSVEFAAGQAALDEPAEDVLQDLAWTLTYALANWRAQGADVLPVIEVEIAGDATLGVQRGRAVERYLGEAVARNLPRIQAQGVTAEIQVTVVRRTNVRGPRVPGAAAGGAGRAVVRFNEDWAVVAALADPQGMERRRTTYPMRRPDEVAELRATLSALEPNERLILLAGLDPAHRRWLATDQATIDALTAAVQTEEGPSEEGVSEGFAALAAALMVEVPEGADAPLAARYEFEQIARRMLRNRAIATEVLRRGTRLLVIPRTNRAAVRGHAPSRWAGGQLPERSFTAPVHPPVLMVSEDNIIGVRDADGVVPYVDGFSIVVHEMAHLAHYMLAPAQRKLITTAYLAARKADHRRIRPWAPAQLGSRWPNGSLYAVHGGRLVSRNNYSSTDEYEFFAHLASAWMGTNVGIDSITRLPMNNGNGWVKQNFPQLVGLLTALFGPGHHGGNAFPANPVNSELQYDYLGDFTVQVARSDAWLRLLTAHLAPGDAEGRQRVWAAWEAAGTAVASARSALAGFGRAPSGSAGALPAAWVQAADALGRANDAADGAGAQLRALGFDPEVLAETYGEFERAAERGADAGDWQPDLPLMDPAVRERARGDAWLEVLAELSGDRHPTGAATTGVAELAAAQRWRAARAELASAGSAVAERAPMSGESGRETASAEWLEAGRAWEEAQRGLDATAAEIRDLGFDPDELGLAHEQFEQYWDLPAGRGSQGAETPAPTDDQVVRPSTPAPTRVRSSTHRLSRGDRLRALLGGITGLDVPADEVTEPGEGRAEAEATVEAWVRWQQAVVSLRDRLNGLRNQEVTAAGMPVEQAVALLAGAHRTVSQAEWELESAALVLADLGYDPRHLPAELDRLIRGSAPRQALRGGTRARGQQEETQPAVTEATPSQGAAQGAVRGTVRGAVPPEEIAASRAQWSLPITPVTTDHRFGLGELLGQVPDGYSLARMQQDFDRLMGADPEAVRAAATTLDRLGTELARLIHRSIPARVPLGQARIFVGLDDVAVLGGAVSLVQRIADALDHRILFVLVQAGQTFEVCPARAQ